MFVLKVTLARCAFWNLSYLIDLLPQLLYLLVWESADGHRVEIKRYLGLELNVEDGIYLFYMVVDTC